MMEYPIQHYLHNYSFMTRALDWERRIGRRLRLRDLHVFFEVIQSGSMVKAAKHLRVTQPAVSKAVGDLEAALGVRLFDRGPQGVAPTIYGQALLKCGSAVFDELRQGIRSIEFLADPTVGEVRIGSAEGMTAAILPPIIQRFSRLYPRVVLQVDDLPSRAQQLSGLIDRTYDFILLRLHAPITSDPVVGHALEDLNIETLFEDRLVLAAGNRSPWARRRKIDLSELVDAPWILVAPGTWNYDVVADAFKARGLKTPKISLVSTSLHLRMSLPASGPFITAVPASVLFLDAARSALKVLPVNLPARPSPLAILTLRNRTLSPVVERFIECSRDIAQSCAPSGGHGTLGPRPER
jgi:DNA-binding transcriptional LysR family regulator